VYTGGTWPWTRADDQGRISTIPFVIVLIHACAYVMATINRAVLIATVVLHNGDQISKAPERIRAGTDDSSALELCAVRYDWSYHSSRIIPRRASIRAQAQ
jgi:hypothetical protein